ncbi:hypothetical protein WDW37_18625 [Bdellovibrionota bacterium FG-1]
MRFFQSIWNIGVLTLLSTATALQIAHADESAAAPTLENTPQMSKTLKNFACPPSGSCALKSFSVEANDYKVTLVGGAWALGTSMTARYRTDQVSQLQDFVVVQFIRGCVFNSRLINGKVEKWLTVGRDFFGKSIRFRHPDWVIDAADTDPVYWSAPQEKKPRHYYYRWNQKPGSTADETAFAFGLKKPNVPELYVQDLPTGADPDYERSVSLKFSTCIFRTQDVPTHIDPSGNALPNAIACLDWASSHVLNPWTGIFESPSEIDPYCLQTQE